MTCEPEEEPTWRWTVVVSPRGDIIRLDSRWCEYTDARSFIAAGINPTGWTTSHPIRHVTVNGAHITLAWREEGHP